MPLTDRQLNRATLARQRLLAREDVAPIDAVRRLVGLQAQEPASPYIALWSRVRGFEADHLDAAFRDFALVKASLMRITLHAVAASEGAGAGGVAGLIAWCARGVGGGLQMGRRHMLFEALETVNARPNPFEVYGASDLWTDEHVSQQLLAAHLDPDVDAASRSATFIRTSVDWIAQHFGVAPGCRIADFGCGPGLYTTALAERHADVTGIDFSERSIRYAESVARERGLTIDYVCRDYRGFASEARFDLILMIMFDFCVLSPEQRGALLTTFASHLKPGGRVLLDVQSLTAFAQREAAVAYEAHPSGGFWSPERHHVFTVTHTYDDAKVALDKHTIVEEGRVRTVHDWLQYFSPAALAAEFAASGLAITETYGNVAGAPFDQDAGEFAVVARRAADRAPILEVYGDADAMRWVGDGCALPPTFHVHLVSEANRDLLERVDDERAWLP